MTATRNVDELNRYSERMRASVLFALVKGGVDVSVTTGSIVTRATGNDAVAAAAVLPKLPLSA